MKTKQKVIVRFYDMNDNHIRTDKFTVASDAGLWLRVNGYSTNGQTSKGRYTSDDGYALVDYGR